MQKLSVILSQLMSDRKINSAALARATAIGQPVIYRLMTGATGNPQVLTLKPIADFFGVTLDQLLGYAPLRSAKLIDKDLRHHLNSKFTTAKTITSAFMDILPLLIDSYSKAIAANIIKESMPEDILPLLPLNAVNLLEAINQIQEILINNVSQD